MLLKNIFVKKKNPLARQSNDVNIFETVLEKLNKLDYKLNNLDYKLDKLINSSNLQINTFENQTVQQINKSNDAVYIPNPDISDVVTSQKELKSQTTSFDISETLKSLEGVS